MFLQQFAAVVTAVRWVLVAKKSRYVRHAVSPPSRTMEDGNSTEIFSSVYQAISMISHIKKGGNLRSKLALQGR